MEDDPKPGKSDQGNRQRDYRRRQRHGIAVHRVEVSEPVLLALIAAGRLTAGDTADRARIDAALTAVVSEWAARWR